jgi:hypothetical protein
VEQDKLPASTAATSMVWRKSTASSSNAPQCLEVAMKTGLVLVRDSKNAVGPDLTFSQSTWTGFLGTLSDGQFEVS